MRPVQEIIRDVKRHTDEWNSIMLRKTANELVEWAELACTERDALRVEVEALRQQAAEQRDSANEWAVKYTYLVGWLRTNVSSGQSTDARAFVGEQMQRYRDERYKAAGRVAAGVAEPGETQ